MFNQNTLNLLGLSGTFHAGSKPVSFARSTFGKVVAVNAGSALSSELSELMDRYEELKNCIIMREKYECNRLR